MELLIVILLLLGFGGYALYQKLTPQDPPIEDMGAHLRQLQSLDPKDRRAFIKQDAARRRANQQTNQEQ